MATRILKTPQAIFTHVVRALRKQGKKSYVMCRGKMTRCAYRGADSLKCAAGHLIPDDQYKPCMENQSAKYLDWFKEHYGEHVELIQALQQIHDGNLVQSWEHEWAKLAGQYDLKMPPGRKLLKEKV